MNISRTYGVDWSTFTAGVPDLDPTFTGFGGDDLVVEAAARRLITPRGSLPGAPDYGYDLRQHMQARLTPLKLAQIRSAIVSEVTKDERITRAECLAESINSGATMRVRLTVSTTTRSYALVLEVSSVSVTLLRG